MRRLLMLKLSVILLIVGARAKERDYWDCLDKVRNVLSCKGGNRFRRSALDPMDEFTSAYLYIVGLVVVVG